MIKQLRIITAYLLTLFFLNVLRMTNERRKEWIFHRIILRILPPDPEVLYYRKRGPRYE